MNSYERYVGMIQGEEVDILPRIPILMHFAAKHAGISYADFAGNPDAMVLANIKLVEDFGFEQLDVMSDPYRETSAFGAEIDYPEEGPPRCVRAPLQGNKDLALLKVLDPESAPRLQDCIKVLAAYKAYGYKRYAITGWVEGPAASGANLRGAQEFLLDFYEDASFVRDLMDTALDGAIRFAEAQIAAGADTIGVGDAIASQLPPELYEQLVVPREKKLVYAIHAAGAFARLHICGNTTHLLEGMRIPGFDLIDLDSMVDMAEARRILGPRVALSGNLDPVQQVMGGSPQSIHDGFERIYAITGGPYFVNAGCEIPAATPDENLRALCKPIAAR